MNRGEPRWKSHLTFLLIKVEKEDLLPCMQFKQEVVEFASEHSNRSAAQRFNVEPKRVREWKDNFDKIKTAKSSRQKLEGGGRKCIDEDLEENLVIWIY